MSPYPDTVSPCPPFTFPRPRDTTPASCLLINSCRIPGTRLNVFYAHATPFHLTFTIHIFFISAVSYGGVCKITGCNLSFISLNDGVCLSLFLIKRRSVLFWQNAGWEHDLTFCEILASFYFKLKKTNACSTFSLFGLIFVCPQKVGEVGE